MKDFEEETVTALRNLFDKVNSLRQIAIRDMLKPETYQLYEENIQAAYDALTTVEDALASMGMKLEVEVYAQFFPKISAFTPHIFPAC